MGFSRPRRGQGEARRPVRPVGGPARVMADIIAKRDAPCKHPLDAIYFSPTVIAALRYIRIRFPAHRLRSCS
jgi:hypothetical protein